MSTKLRILFLAAEAEPFVKVGGLADVAGSLPVALRELTVEETGSQEMDVRLVLPMHQIVRANSNALHLAAEFNVSKKGTSIPVKVFETRSGDLPVYFIDSPPLSTSDRVYSIDPGVDREKYLLFSLAALTMTGYVSWQPQVIHVNDWHTALALYGIRTHPEVLEGKPVRTLITVHNLPYMGGDCTSELEAYGLPLSDIPLLPKWAQTQPLPLGLWSADKIVPVSPTYAQEIMSPEFGCGLEGYLHTRKNDVTGILNGIDLRKWNPAKDTAIAAPFSFENPIPRIINKQSLQQKLGLPINDRILLLAMIGRVDRQKGLDIVFDALHMLAEEVWQFILLGTGDPVLETAARELQQNFPDQVRVNLLFDSELSRQIYAGADCLVMPSRYEPCGLAQMIAMRYGCLPLVHATGGLKDTVSEGRTGFLFDSLEAAELSAKLKLLLDFYCSDRWKEMQNNAMQADFSWGRSAREYAALYNGLIHSKPDRMR